MVLIIDNYDSFTYNLFQLIGDFTGDIRVARNDAISLDEIVTMKPSHIVLSPGPGHPKDAVLCGEIIRLKALPENPLHNVPVLGVCLGHQAICECYGMNVSTANQIMHGKKSEVRINNKSLLFKGLDAKITVGRYHSLVAKPLNNARNGLSVISEDINDGEIMAVEDNLNLVYGIQFHPESILTENGRAIIGNFLSMGEKNA